MLRRAQDKSVSRFELLLGPIRSRQAVILIDQICSGLSNYIFLIYAAHVLTLSDLGRLSLIYTVYASAIAVSRSSLGQAILLWGAPVKAQTGSLVLAIGISVLQALATVVVGAISNQLQTALILAAFAGGLLLADVRRYHLIQMASVTRLISYDASWLILELLGFAYLGTQFVSTQSITFVYGLAGTLSIIWLCPMRDLAPAKASDRQPLAGRILAESIVWIKDSRRGLATFAYESGWQSIWANLSGLLLTTVVSYEVLGGYRASQAPALPLTSAIGAVSVLLAVSIGRGGKSSLSWSLTIVPSLCLVLAGVFVILDSRGWVGMLFGDNVEKYSLEAGLILMAASISPVTATAAIRLRHMRDFKFIFWFRTFAAPLETILFLLLGFGYGVIGTVLGFALSTAMNGVIPAMRLALLNRRAQFIEPGGLLGGIDQSFQGQQKTLKASSAKFGEPS